jgi:hypothetical protein
VSSCSCCWRGAVVTFTHNVTAHNEQLQTTWTTCCCHDGGGSYMPSLFVAAVVHPSWQQGHMQCCAALAAATLSPPHTRSKPLSSSEHSSTTLYQVSCTGCHAAARPKTGERYEGNERTANAKTRFSLAAPHKRHASCCRPFGARHGHSSCSPRLPCHQRAPGHLLFHLEQPQRHLKRLFFGAASSHNAVHAELQREDTALVTLGGTSRCTVYSGNGSAEHVEVIFGVAGVC